MIQITNQQAESLARMAKWFQGMIVDRNVGTPGLTAEYCQELIDALDTKRPGRLHGVYHPIYCMEYQCSFMVSAVQMAQKQVKCWSCNGTNIVQNNRDVNIKSDVIDGKATRLLKPGEMINIEINEYMKIVKENNNAEQATS